MLYIPHGGGPLPLLGDPGHARLVEFLQRCTADLPRPTAILVISAHWEEAVCTVQTGGDPGLLYDYYNFPPESYDIRYPAPGAPAIARATVALLEAAGIAVRADGARPFDHGVFVPLTLMYPDADIPCFQVSLLDSLDPQVHLDLGAALAPLREQGVLLLGSGSSFHNMQALRDGGASLERCERFDDWLGAVCTTRDLAVAQKQLASWEAAPDARYAHPREEHLLPLHVCFGAAAAAGAGAKRVFNGDLMGYRMSAFLWR